jgi:N-acetylglutamate synthase-like GNAT family acetyltransferase
MGELKRLSRSPQNAPKNPRLTLASPQLAVIPGAENHPPREGGWFFCTPTLDDIRNPIMDDRTPPTEQHHPPLQQPHDSLPGLRSAQPRTTAAGTVTVRIAHQSELAAINAIQKCCSNQVGHIPLDDMHKHLAAGNYLTAGIGDETNAGDATYAGYLLGKTSLRWQKQLATIIQIAINPEMRKHNVGTALLNAFIERCKAANAIGIQANCATTIAANTWWQHKHFVQICTMTPDTARARPIACWRLPLTKKLPLWFAQPPARAGWQNKRPDCRNPKAKECYERDQRTRRPAGKTPQGN